MRARKMGYEECRKRFSEGLERVRRGAIPLHLEIDDFGDYGKVIAIELDPRELLRIDEEGLIRKYWSMEETIATGYGAYSRIVQGSNNAANEIREGKNVPKDLISKINSEIGRLEWYASTWGYPYLFRREYGRIVREGEKTQEWIEKREKYNWGDNTVVVAVWNAPVYI